MNSFLDSFLLSKLFLFDHFLSLLLEFELSKSSLLFCHLLSLFLGSFNISFKFFSSCLLLFNLAGKLGSNFCLICLEKFLLLLIFFLLCSNFISMSLNLLLNRFKVLCIFEILFFLFSLESFNFSFVFSLGSSCSSILSSLQISFLFCDCSFLGSLSLFFGFLLSGLLLSENFSFSLFFCFFSSLNSCSSSLSSSFSFFFSFLAFYFSLLFSFDGSELLSMSLKSSLIIINFCLRIDEITITEAVFVETWKWIRTHGFV